MTLNLLAFSVSGARDGSLASAAGAISKVTVEASIPDCDINVDGAFAGSTPSELALASGQHQITIHKQGYADWTRTLTVSGAAIRLHAELQPETAAK